MSTTETIELLREASKFVQAQVRTYIGDDGEPTEYSEWDVQAHDLACRLACEADRLERAAIPEQTVQAVEPVRMAA
jgi:hypothetical protein